MLSAGLNVPTTPTAAERSRGRGYFWAGLGACLLGLLLPPAQIHFRYLGTPWYCPVLGTVGAYLLLISLFQRRTIVRAVALVLVTALTGLEWYFFISLIRLPDYDGPAQPGKQLPAFTSTRADGRSFTDADLRDGSHRALVFFRGRW